MTTFTGISGIGAYQALTIAHALELYHKHKMKVNRAYTPSAMMRAASQITGAKFAPRDYAGAAAACRQVAETLARAARHAGEIRP